jgi:FlaG/FlaF family flagellin (archaellin)
MISRSTILLAAVAAMLAMPASAQVSASVGHASVKSVGSTPCSGGYVRTTASGGPVCAHCSHGTLMTHPTSQNPVCVSCTRGTPSWNGVGFVCR